MVDKTLVDSAKEMGAKELPKRIFRNITPTFFTFVREGDFIEGRLTEKGTTEVEGRQVGRYVLIQDDGKLMAVLGGVVMDRELERVAIGTYIRIRLSEIAKTKRGMRINLFQVEVADEEATN